MHSPIGVTVVVPTLNRGEFLYHCLKDLIAQNYRPMEILVVDQSTSIPSSISELVAANTDLISYHTVQFRGLPLARNYGCKHARYDAIVFIDDDTRLSPTLVYEHVRVLQMQNVGAVAGRIDERSSKVRHGQRTGYFNYWTATPETGFDKAGEFNIDTVQGANFSTWRHIVEEVGGFDELLNVGAALYEETEFSLRLRQYGYRNYYNSRAQLEHLAAPSGGCRVDTVEPYFWALAHNRTLLIRRYLRWFQQPTAFAELVRLGLAYAVYYRQIRVLRALVDGCRVAFHRSKIEVRGNSQGAL